MSFATRLACIVLAFVPFSRGAHAQWIEMNSSMRAHVDVALQSQQRDEGLTTLWAVVLHDDWASTHRRAGTDPWTRHATQLHDGTWTRVWMPPIQWRPGIPRALVARSAGGAWIRDLVADVELAFLGEDGEQLVSAGMTGDYPDLWKWIAAGVADDLGPEGGRVRIWRETAPGEWSAFQTLVAPQGVARNGFGRSLAIDGERLAIGARDAAYMYTLDGDAWEFVARVDGPPEEDHGCSVGLRSNPTVARLYIGAPEAGDASAGRIYVHLFGPNPALVQTLEGDAPGARLGADMDGVGTKLYVPVRGAPGELRSYFSNGEGQLVLDGVFDSPALGSAFPELFDAATSAIVTSTTIAGLQPRSFIHEFRDVPIGPQSTYYAFCAADAPCGNADPIGGCANASGEGARLHLLSDATAGNTFLPDWKVSGRRLPAHALHILFVGTLSKSVPFGDGLLAVGGQTLRFPVQLADADGFSLLQLDAAPLPALPCYMQLWYRDPLGPCESGFNFSNAVEVRF